MYASLSGANFNFITRVIKRLEISVEIQSAHGDTQKASGDADG
jgi:hypothetical protein